jgi:DNA-binding MarR family transcriptional regulator
MATLCALESGDSVDFASLKKMLKLTDGNLGSHLEKLEESYYLSIEKTKSGRNAKMFIQSTDLGRAAYDGHRRALLAMLENPDDLN